MNQTPDKQTKVRRFTPCHHRSADNGMIEAQNGKYVLYSDYSEAFGAYFKSCVAMDAKLATLEAERDHAISCLRAIAEKNKADLDSDSIIAACNCLTKTPDTQFHKAGCKYRLILERDSAKIAQQALSAEVQKLREALAAITRRAPIMGSRDDFRAGQLEALEACSQVARAALNSTAGQPEKRAAFYQRHGKHDIGGGPTAGEPQ